MGRFHVQTAQLHEICGHLAGAARACADLLAHPGALRGRASDGGDPQLRAAAELFAQRWQDGLQVMGADAGRLADALRLVAQTYERADAAVTSALAPRHLGRG